MIFSSNIGGTATLIGDPPNIMIGSATGLTFNDFAWNLAPVIIVVQIATLIPIYFIWGRQLRANAEDRQRVMQFNEFEAIKDWRLLKQCLSVIGLVVFGFIFAKWLHLEAATIAIFGAAVPVSYTHLDVYKRQVAPPRKASDRSGYPRSPQPGRQWRLIGPGPQKQRFCNRMAANENE